MNRTGQVRPIDHLGRVCIPASVRKELNLREGDAVSFSIVKNDLVLSKYFTSCSLCGSEHDVRDFILDSETGRHTIKVCQRCLCQMGQTVLKDGGLDK